MTYKYAIFRAIRIYLFSPDLCASHFNPPDRPTLRDHVPPSARRIYEWAQVCAVRSCMHATRVCVHGRRSWHTQTNRHQPGPGRTNMRRGCTWTRAQRCRKFADMQWPASRETHGRTDTVGRTDRAGMYTYEPPGAGPLRPRTREYARVFACVCVCAESTPDTQTQYTHAHTHHHQTHAYTTDLWSA